MAKNLIALVGSVNPSSAASPLFFGMAAVLYEKTKLGSGTKCDDVHRKVPINFVENYCHNNGAFTYISEYYGTVGENAIAPNVPMYPTGTGKMLYQSYYRWAPLVSAFIGALHFIPQLIWKEYAGGHLTELFGEGNDDKSEAIVDKYARSWHDNRRRSALDATVYFLCNLMNVVIAILVAVLLDMFTDNALSAYGLTAIYYASLPSRERNDDLIARFPTVALCDYPKLMPRELRFQYYEYQCNLYGNKSAENAIIFAYFFECALAFVSCAYLWGAALARCSKGFRNVLLSLGNNDVTKRSIGKIFGRKGVPNSRQATYGDYFYLIQIKANVSSDTYGKIVRRILELQEKSDSSCCSIPCDRLSSESE